MSSALEKDRKPGFPGVQQAYEKISAVLPPSPIHTCEIAGRTVRCKAESLQPVGAFKLRGAWHRLTDLSDAERRAGVVAFSSGNHAQGVAWAAGRLGIEATIVMPSDAPGVKVERTRALGADIVFYDRMTEDRIAIATGLADERGATIVPPFADPWIIEGQGSAGIEAREQLGFDAVSDAEVGAAMRFAYREMGLVVEPGGAAGLAVLLSGKIAPAGRTLVILSGGNVEPAVFERMTA